MIKNENDINDAHKELEKCFFDLSVLTWRAGMTDDTGKAWHLFNIDSRIVQEHEKESQLRKKTIIIAAGIFGTGAAFCISPILGTAVTAIMGPYLLWKYAVCSSEKTTWPWIMRRGKDLATSADGWTEDTIVKKLEPCIYKYVHMNGTMTLARNCEPHGITTTHNNNELLCTHGLSSCIAIAVIQDRKDGVYRDRRMVHLAGGLPVDDQMAKLFQNLRSDVKVILAFGFECGSFYEDYYQEHIKDRYPDIHLPKKAEIVFTGKHDVAGTFKLLPDGTWRPLTKNEVAYLMRGGFYV